MSTTAGQDVAERGSADCRPDSRVKGYSVEWGSRKHERYVALFRTIPDHDIAILQHIRTIRTQQRGGPSGCTIDTDPTLSDVPSWILEEVRADGYTAVEDGRNS